MDRRYRQSHRGKPCEHGGRDQSDASPAVQLETRKGKKEAGKSEERPGWSREVWVGNVRDKVKNLIRLGHREVETIETEVVS